MPNGQSVTRESTSGRNGDNARWSGSEGDIEANASISNEWRGEVGEDIEHGMLLWDSERRRSRHPRGYRSWDPGIEPVNSIPEPIDGPRIEQRPMERPQSVRARRVGLRTGVDRRDSVTDSDVRPSNQSSGNRLVVSSRWSVSLHECRRRSTHGGNGTGAPWLYHPRSPAGRSTNAEYQRQPAGTDRA
jgi:hypothetical protein